MTPVIREKGRPWHDLSFILNSLLFSYDHGDSDAVHSWGIETWTVKNMKNMNTVNVKSEKKQTPVIIVSKQPFVTMIYWSLEPQCPDDHTTEDMSRFDDYLWQVLQILTENLQVGSAWSLSVTTSSPPLLPPLSASSSSSQSDQVMLSAMAPSQSSP